MPQAKRPSPTQRVRAVLDPALGSRARLDFLLALSHELRTPVGVIVGYSSLARQGEVPTEEALDVIEHQATELAALLELTLTAANAALDEGEAWDERVRDALANSIQLKESIDSLATSVRRRRALDARGGDEVSERRDVAARAARDELAELVSVHPRSLGALPLDVVSRLLNRVERHPPATAAGA